MKNDREEHMKPEDYCNALRTWASLAVPAKQVQRSSVDDVRRAISKSCLIHRLIYGGEKLREHKCPLHRGRWSGCAFGEWCPAWCMYGSNVTGWIENGMAETSLLGFGWTFWLTLALGVPVPTMPPPEFCRAMSITDAV